MLHLPLVFNAITNNDVTTLVKASEHKHAIFKLDKMVLWITLIFLTPFLLHIYLFNEGFFHWLYCRRSDN